MVTNTFGPRMGTINEFFPSVSADSAGTAWLIGSQLFHSNLSPIRDLSPAGWRPGTRNGVTLGRSVLSPDGVDRRIWTRYGFARVSTTDGVQLEDVRLPIVPTWLGIALTAGLAAIAGTVLILVDLPVAL